MPILKIGDDVADVDIREELEQFPWHRPRWTSEKLIAASPFRYDRTPSFFVNLDGEYAGTWADSGAYDADYESGNFVKLLAFLRDETYEETAEYLLSTYGLNSVNAGDNLRLPKLHLPKQRKPVVLAETTLKPYAYKHPYLTKRGISEKVQRFMGVGFSRQANAITLPWRYANGKLANVKYRKTQGKAFWYRKGAEPVRHLVYGIDKVYRHGLSEVYICEAEIDVMSVYTAGKPAIAIGGASISDKQIELIRKSPIERVIIATDSDKAGEKVKRQLIDALKGAVELREVLPFPSGVKDVNEALVSGNVEAIRKTKPVGSVRISYINL
ncbi:toprim domain-containing protein [Virgibacillus proomii]|uniref:toprim domain-containing protein n=1 Tax=Virgibacillus proomii TaxID=84407 RepID=UPI001C0F43D8|nr:toprim domain-containing protein [Virgibacillus proomii]MBU5266239.1 toprim domain-containing protein [Virgibacillus proomii]